MSYNSELFYLVLNEVNESSLPMRKTHTVDVLSQVIRQQLSHELLTAATKAYRGSKTHIHTTSAFLPAFVHLSQSFQFTLVIADHELAFCRPLLA